MNTDTLSPTQWQHSSPSGPKATGSRKFSALLAASGFVTFLLASATSWAQVAPPASNWQQFGALSSAGLSGQAGSGALVNGSVGSNTAISNFPPSQVAPGFSVFPVADPIVQLALIDANNAYNFLAAQGPGTVINDNLATVGPLTTGVYSTTTGAADLPAGAVLILNGPGIFVFNVDSLTANVLSSVQGTANPCDVYWRVGSSATLNGNTFRGTVLALASVSIGDIVGPLVGVDVQGSVVGITAAVTMAGDGGTIVGGCSAAAALSGAFRRVPTLSQWGLIMLAGLMALAGFAALRGRAR